MRKVGLGLGFAAILLVKSAAFAAIGTIDDVPAATLLLPYFEVDTNGTASTGVTTLLSINNASATAALAHVVVWSDLAVPVLIFNVYLTGYDMSTFNLQDLFNGGLPVSASAGQDPMDKLSPKGQFSQDINFASCTGQLPPPQLSADFVAHLKASLSGKASPVVLGGKCAGLDHGDAILRGYVTVDTVNNCTLRSHDSTYIISDITFQNILTGHYAVVDKATKRAYSGNLVPIEASLTDPLTTTSGNYTFYGRYVNWNASDHREALATSFSARYLATGSKAFPSVSDLIVWRDPKVSQQAFTCGTLPAWYPLGQEGIVVFDEQEHPQVQPVQPVGPQPPGPNLIPFAAATRRVRVNSAALPVSFTSGWMYLDLNATVTPAGSNPPADPASAQAWVEVVQEDADGAYGTKGRIGALIRAFQLDNASGASHFVP